MLERCILASEFFVVNVGVLWLRSFTSGLKAFMGDDKLNGLSTC